MNMMVQFSYVGIPTLMKQNFHFTVDKVHDYQRTFQAILWLSGIKGRLL